MGHTRTKTLTVIFSLLAWIFFLILSKFIRNTLLLNPIYFQKTTTIFLFYLSIPIFFITLILELPFVLVSTIVTTLAMAIFFNPKISALPIALLISAGLLGRKMGNLSRANVKNTEIETEKFSENFNLLSEKIKLEEKNNFRMRHSLERITYLKNIVENYSQRLEEEDVLNSIVKSSFELFENANRILLYLVDTEKQELMLARSKKRNIDFSIRAKNGDVFDKWTIRHRMPLIVEDIYKDFRFTPEENFDKGFNSLISTPLVSENKVLGILRVDSNKKHSFSQSDLRFLDIIGDISSVSLRNAILYKRVQDLAIHDSLTGLYVHKYFIEKLKHEIKRSLRSDMDISLLMLDLDNFKSYNDRYGHNAGDLVLKHISAILRSFAKPLDIVSRYGGEEFTLLLLNKDKDKASKIAEKIRAAMKKTPLILRRQMINMTVSIGVASCPTEAKTVEEFLKIVDARLYKAKKNGKDQVCLK